MLWGHELLELEGTSEYADFFSFSDGGTKAQDWRQNSWQEVLENTMVDWGNREVRVVRASETPRIKEESTVEQDDSDPVCRQEMANDYLQWSLGMAGGLREQAGEGSPISAWGAHVSPWVTPPAS